MVPPQHWLRGDQPSAEPQPDGRRESRRVDEQHLDGVRSFVGIAVAGLGGEVRSELDGEARLADASGEAQQTDEAGDGEDVRKRGRRRLLYFPE
jgi:hypothetical protein